MTEGPDAVSVLRARIREMAAAWRALTDATSPLDADWRATFGPARARYEALRRGGRWKTGPSDLMTVLGRADDEIAHSRVVAWLLDSCGQHGLGSALLARILDAGWPAFPLSDLAEVTIRREVPRPEATGDTRADIVVWIGSTVLVIENKVWSPESEGQCDALYRHWIDEADDVRFLLLSRDGHLPVSATSDEVRRAWRAVSYRQLAGLLVELMSGTPRSDAGRAALEQYLVALRRVVGAPTTFPLSLGGPP